MTQATTLQTLIQGTSQVPNVGSPKSYKRASRINTSLFPPTITHSNWSTCLASQLYPNTSSLRTPPNTALIQPTSLLKEDPPYLIKVTSYAPWVPPNLKPTYYTLLQLRISWPLTLCSTHSPFALQTSGIPNQVVWATNSGCTKPRARILATGALHVPNHVPTLDQLA